MGIKAVVEAIHEPPQDGDLDGLSLELPWGDEERIVSLARQAGLSAVGIIFTDLTPEPNDKSKSVCKRHANSFFLSSLETLFAAQLQLDHPTSTRSSPTGKFSSRLVTAVLSGTPDGKIDVAAYQVSEQGCAMLDADMIEPSVEPGTVRVKEETEGRYIPDVFFRFKNEFGIEVKQSAKPCFPVEYLIVNVTHGFPTNPSSIFLSHNFPVENRPFTHPQDTNAIFSTLSRLRASEIRSSRRGSDPEMAEKRRNLLKWLSDWHLLAFLPSTGMLSEEDMEVVMKTAVSPSLDDPKVLDALLSSDGWQTLLTIAQETAPLPRAQSSGSASASRPDIIPPLQEPVSSSRSGPQPMDDDFIPPEILEESLRANPPGGTAGGSATRICPHCTFENPPGGPDCEVCGLPLSG
jgi:nuclear protein localization family protein 4